MSILPKLQVVRLEGVSIFRQLEIEEALLRAGSGNWCVMNYGSEPAIVMGMSGKIDEIRTEASIPVFRRFSGGGTVVVDENTVFFSLIMNEKDLLCQANPVDVMAWTGVLIAPAFAPKKMVVEEQDYVIEGQKIGGNAQSFSRSRILHHTSFLWSWEKERMALLNMPKRQPAYRMQRGHESFCHKLSCYFASKDEMVQALERCLGTYFDCQRVSEIEACEVMKWPHRKTLQVVAKDRMTIMQRRRKENAENF